MNKLKTIISIFAMTCVAPISMKLQASPITFVDLGIIGSSGTYTFDTEGSVYPGSKDIDTVLGLWDETGTLIKSDDDSGSGHFSSITWSLADGIYWLGSSEFDLDYKNNWKNKGSGFEPGEVGDMALRINGNLVSTIADVDENAFSESAWWKFEITNASVPEPASLALLGIGLAGFRFSRKKLTTEIGAIKR